MATVSNDGVGAQGGTQKPIAPPIKLAHIVLRTSRYDEMLAWYQRALRMRVVFGNEALSFLTYDEEHHRLAVVNVPDLAEQAEGVCGVHHIAFTYDTLSTLMENYAILKEGGVVPVYVINHGPTTSLYYADPDGNQIEFQVENFATIEEGTDFFYSDAFKDNPVGVEFDPDDLLARVRAGEPEQQLRLRPDIGKRGMEGVNLR
jgi:catechol 2,3-dioxygenase-like lactoylglutathione lyase family enzyme